MDLGQLQALTLGIINSKGEASSKEVWNEIMRRRKISYTTIVTTLNRLHKKGLLRREAKIGRGGQKYIYFFRDNQELQKQIVDESNSTVLV